MPGKKPAQSRLMGDGVRSALEKLSDAELRALVTAIIREIGVPFVAEPEGDVAP